MFIGGSIVLLIYLLNNSVYSSMLEFECVEHSYPPKNRPNIPSYDIHLDLPPNQRWKNIGNAEGEKIKIVLNAFKDFILNISKYSELIINFVDSGFQKYVEDLPYPYSDELKGLASAANLNLGELAFYNLFYEFFTVCTSIIAEDPSGKLFHARNLDFGLLLGWDLKNKTWLMPELLRNSVVNLRWLKNGKHVFSSINFAGYIGILTAVKPGVFTFSINERFNIDGGFIGLLKWLLGYRESNWMSFLTRKTLEEASSYEEAKKWLSNEEMIAPAYFILGGNKTGQACIITRSRQKAVDVWNIGTRNSTWYLVETNYDHWDKPLIIDNRRDPAIKCLNHLTQEFVGFPGLFDVLSSKPMLNKLTTYTALMQVHSNSIEAYLQYCEDPCTPW